AGLSLITQTSLFRKRIFRVKKSNYQISGTDHFASMLAQRGISLFTVQKLLGHKTVAMTQRYAHPAPDNLRTAINLLNNQENKFTAQIGHSGQNA
ncbi:MAG: tyrosine-type recombinase/integrase, partial [bacterium]